MVIWRQGKLIGLTYSHMSQSSLSRLLSAASLLRPRTIVRALKQLDRLQASMQTLHRDLPRLADDTSRVAQRIARLEGRAERRDTALKELRREAGAAAKRDADVMRQGEQIEALAERLATLSTELAALNGVVSRLSEQVDSHTRQAEQHAQVQRLDKQHESFVRKWERLDTAAVADHVRASIERAVVRDHPFPHAVIEGLLPDHVYAHVIEALPPRVFFEDKTVNKQQLKVPLALAPRYSQLVWKFVVGLVDDVVGPELQRKFRPQIEAYLASICQAATEDAAMAMTVSDGRIMLRRPGYVIHPHRDPKWGFLSTLMYLARPGDEESYGTQLYHVREDSEAPSEAPLYVDASRCELVSTVPFRRNTALVFLNSHGAHGASIPADAPPQTERYLYQFRIGPDAASIRKIVALMPEATRLLWVGDKVSRLIEADHGY